MTDNCRVNDCQKRLLVAALEDIISDIHEYERANNLAPNPDRTECWDSVARAKLILRDVGNTLNRDERA